MDIRRFEEIEAWQLARGTAQAIYKASREGSFPKDYALRDQIDRASGSAMDNIAEGFDAATTPEFVRFLRYAQRSCSEVQSQLYRTLDREHLTGEQFADLSQKVKETHSRINGFIKCLKELQAKASSKRKGHPSPISGKETRN